MNFLAPAAFFFAAVLPVVVVFYLLKRKRVVHLVSSTLLWRQYLAETQASAPFQKLRRNWLLILQLLMLLLAILALSRPYFDATKVTGRLLVLVLDASASMQSRDVDPSRFDAARDGALDLVDALAGTDQMIIIQAAATTTVLQSPTSDKSALRRALTAARVTDSPTRLIEALTLAENLTEARANAEIHVFSDGAVSDLHGFSGEDLAIVFHQIGARAENVAITSLDVRPHPEDPRLRALFTSVVNYGTATTESTLELLRGDEVRDVRVVRLGPGATAPEVFTVAQTEDEVYTVRLDVEDDLAVDNRASVVSLTPKPVRVLLLSAGNNILQKALASVPNVELATAGNLAQSDTGADVVVLDGVAPAFWPESNLLAIRSANTNWFKGAGTLENPAIVDWRNTHSLLRFVSFDNVYLRECLVIEPPTWAISLVDSPETPLILAGELDRQRIVWLAFDPLDSTWPLRISFPIFVHNAVDWLNPAGADNRQFTIQVGQPLRLGLKETVTEATVRVPSGATRTIPVDPSAGEVLFGDTLAQGIYELSAGTNTFRFAANLLDAAESDLTPRAELQMGSVGAVEATETREASLEIWRWIAIGALGVLMFEWWYYHRRMA